MPPEVEYNMWRQLRGLGVDKFIFTPALLESVVQYPTMEEALTHITGNKVFLESTGLKTMNDLPSRDEDVTFILGNTSLCNKKHTTPEESYRINEPSVSSMYPTSAAAIALAFWHGQ